MNKETDMIILYPDKERDKGANKRVQNSDTFQTL